MELENALLWEVSLFEFVVVTCILAGGTAWLTGKSIANGWLGNGILVFYVALIACAARFIHFALYDGTLLTLHYYTVDFIVLLGFAFAGKTYTRMQQMKRQYAFEQR